MYADIQKEKKNHLGSQVDMKILSTVMGALSTVLHVLQLKIQAKSGKESHCQVPEQSTTS
jgi:hypothetical protein